MPEILETQTADRLQQQLGQQQQQSFYSLSKIPGTLTAVRTTRVAGPKTAQVRI
jgi:hypothetical protein